MSDPSTSGLGFGLEASHDPAVILSAVREKNMDMLHSYDNDRQAFEAWVQKRAEEVDWAASQTISGFAPLVFKTRAHHVVATGAWPFLEERFRRMQAELAENKNKRGAKKTLVLHLAAPDGRWFTITAPGGEVALAKPGAKKARGAETPELRFLWLNDHLVLTADSGSSPKRAYGQSVLAPNTELTSVRVETVQPDGRVFWRSEPRSVPSRVTWDWIEALCQAACDLSPESLAEFGKLTGICAVCGRGLTDKLSKARGIGPVCWEQVMEAGSNV